MAADGFRRFAVAGYVGEATTVLPEARLAEQVHRLADPAAATATVHWGRNYLFRATVELAGGPLEVVVKQFRHDAWRQRLDRRLKGSKAARSFAAARALGAAGIATAEPVAVIESEALAGPCFFVSRHLAGGVEARYFFRALRAGRAAEEFPELPAAAVVEAIAELVRRLHAAAIWHRDLSIGNLLLFAPERSGEAPRLALLDLNRCRLGRPLSTSERTRDLCRLPIGDAALADRFLARYWGVAPERLGARRTLYRLYARSFLARHALRPALRELGGRLRRLFFARGVHPHIPQPPAGARVEDRAVWDPLSDQPHLHAGRLDRARARVSELPAHLAAAAAASAGLARAWPRHRALVRELFARAVPLAGVGVALRPWPSAPQALLTALDELSVRHVLLRLHPWQERHDEEEALARELAARGCDLAFALPQSRELVRDRARWRGAVAELAERFAPYGRRFQLGQAINRSKWGVWSYAEYLDLAAEAAAIVRRQSDVELLGPAVIDFEPHALAAALNLGGPALSFDIVSTLLYVDRRGAPENRQLGFDTPAKLALTRAIAATSRRGADRLWVTEVNWPLAEGPHSPAGRAVAVDEATQAAFLLRYLLLALGSGMVERVYWWQPIAKGYGLIDPAPDGTLRRRPAFAALAQFARHLAGATTRGGLVRQGDGRLLAVTLSGGGEAWVGWSVADPLVVPAPAAIGSARDLATGASRPLAHGGALPLDSTPVLFTAAG